MPIKLRPEIIDIFGFRRRAWDFDHAGIIYHIQETAHAYLVMKQAADQSWRVIKEQEAQLIVSAFERERGPDLTGTR